LEFQRKDAKAQRRQIISTFPASRLALKIARIQMSSRSTGNQLVAAARRLDQAVSRLRFSAPVALVYNPLAYARQPHETYLRKFGDGGKRVIFLGMNPGPFGMAQTGVPFGEVAAVRDWLKIEAPVGHPPREHPKRPVLGFACAKSEVSGRRLWGLFAERFGTAENFSQEHFVTNYCPLAFMEDSGRNLTPDKLKAGERIALQTACDAHFAEVVKILEPEWIIGVGDFAAKRAKLIVSDDTVRIGQILHPSPASPFANRGWAKLAEAQLKRLGLWL
jgi:single-strand selective monofunctional uracil DNA glycosylase